MLFPESKNLGGQKARTILFTERKQASRCNFPESGAVTAELAIGIPALLVVASLVLGAIDWGVDAVAATSVAAETARVVARGEDIASSLGVSESAVPGAVWSASIGVETVCVTAILPPPVPLAPPVSLDQCVPR